METTSPPEISVIIPVHNGSRELHRLLPALRAQTVAPERFEVLVADNGSTDDTASVVRGLLGDAPFSWTLVDAGQRRGSYAARNTALALVRGRFLAFTDADCVPVPGWLAAGVAALVDGPADLVGGRVTFTFRRPDRPGPAEWVDSRTNMQMEADIVQRGVTKTANLFVRREVWEKIGSFPGHLKSGGDVWWTGAAVAAGFRLVYAPEAEVMHPARNLAQLLAKQLRVGYGQIPVMRAKGIGPGGILRDCLQFRDARKGFHSRVAASASPVSPPSALRRPPQWQVTAAKVACRLGTLAGRLAWVLSWPFHRGAES